MVAKVTPPFPAVFPVPSCSWTQKKMAAALCRLVRASTWMPEWPLLLTSYLTGEPTPSTWAACCPTVLTPCLDRLPASQNSGDMEGQVSEESSKTKSQISHTLYQSNILEAQSRSQFRQKSCQLQSWRGLRVFFPSPPRSAEELPIVATWHKARMLTRLAHGIINKRWKAVTNFTLLSSLWSWQAWTRMWHIPNYILLRDK